jgi:acyl-CoA reductase-like NAD-dependent aldehyde dehydrogenase
MPVAKTYKIYINGKFPRTESGRYYALTSLDGRTTANICRCSRKDLRDAVAAARAAAGRWAETTAYLRGQILYRIAEMLEGRRAQFEDELQRMGAAPESAAAEVAAAVDRWVYYAGWADKYQQVFSSVNPVASPHFCFSMLEPMGVVGILAPEESALLGLVSMLAPAIVGGNAAVLAASYRSPLCAVTLAEVIHASDVPAGVVNILTGRREELLDPMASHLDVNAILCHRADAEQRRRIQELAAHNVKRVHFRDRTDWEAPDAEDPYLIADTQEIKTTWHPIGT